MVDLRDEGTWKAIASRLGPMPIADAVAVVARCTDQVMRLRLLSQKGASGAMLSELRCMARELFGGGEEAAWEGP
jgi:hypothetical protein